MYCSRKARNFTDFFLPSNSSEMESLLFVFHHTIFELTKIVENYRLPPRVDIADYEVKNSNLWAWENSTFEECIILDKIYYDFAIATFLCVYDCL